MFRKIKILIMTVSEMIRQLPSIIKESGKEWSESEEAKRINEYWDEKTVFVHRRAFFVGIILGFLMGWYFFFWIATLAITIKY